MRSRSEPAQQELAPIHLAPTQLARRLLPTVLLSGALHGGVLAFVLLLGTAVRNKVIEPDSRRAQALVEIAGGSHAVMLELPAAQMAARTRKPTLEPEASAKTILPVEKTFPKMRGGGAPKTPHAGDGSSTALTGNGGDPEDARPAFPIFSPRPPVTDRSLLPASEQKIVVDVQLDPLGQVVSEKLVKGMGNRLDQLVLAIVKTWRFQPATVNGKPVPSEAECIFPFNPSYPITAS